MCSCPACFLPSLALQGASYPLQLCSASMPLALRAMEVYGLLKAVAAACVRPCMLAQTGPACCVNRTLCSCRSSMAVDGRVPVVTNGCFGDVEPARSGFQRRAALEKPAGRAWVVHCRPRVSAIRWLNLGVSFPAVSSRGRPALADPQQSVVPLQS